MNGIGIHLVDNLERCTSKGGDGFTCQFVCPIVACGKSIGCKHINYVRSEMPKEGKTKAYRAAAWQLSNVRAHLIFHQGQLEPNDDQTDEAKNLLLFDDPYNADCDILAEMIVHEEFVEAPDEFPDDNNHIADNTAPNDTTLIANVITPNQISISPFLSPAHSKNTIVRKEIANGIAKYQNSNSLFGSPLFSTPTSSKITSVHRERGAAVKSLIESFSKPAHFASS